MLKHDKQVSFFLLKYSGENKYDKCEIINRLLWTKCLDSKCNKKSHQIQIPIWSRWAWTQAWVTRIEGALVDFQMKRRH